jgi:hypothetical protein
MNAPKRIWVDSCKDADGEPEWDTGAWGHDQQEGDEEYVRADLFAKAVEELDEYKAAAAIWQEDFIQENQRLYEAKVKLAMAVEYLKKLDRRGDALETFDPVVHEIVTAALAELEGE